MANILIIDDAVALSSLIEFTLVDLDYSVKVVHAGMEGWKELKSGGYDLVILDWDMPDLNGIDLLKMLRDGGDNTPVIMLTGHTAVSDRVSGLLSGANDYLVKPFHIDELVARVVTVLRTQSAIPAAPKSLGQHNEEVLEKGNLAGTSLAARYEFQEVWGEGGAAIVFKALHPALEKLVAIKMLKSPALSQEVVARFEREAKAISRLDHPNIITVYDFGVTERNNPYMVMEFINGDDLKRTLDRRDLLPPSEALDLLRAVCLGLECAHKAGVIHRDIKPGNIMLKQVPDEPLAPKILDFGMAKFKEPDPAKTVALTQARQIFGSPSYMSPEQIRGHVLDERTDIYSLGCTFFHVLAGLPPHMGRTAFEIMDSRLEQPPLTFAQVHPETVFPEGLQDLLSKALELSPEKRYQSVKEMRQDLEKVRLQVAEATGAADHASHT